MTHENKDSCCVQGVGCNVANCKYHDAACSCCTADHIKAENKTATEKDETFCSTFTPKASW